MAQVDDEIADASDDETKKPGDNEDIGGDKLIVSKASKPGKGALQGKAKGKAKAKAKG